MITPSRPIFWGHELKIKIPLPLYSPRSPTGLLRIFAKLMKSFEILVSFRDNFLRHSNISSFQSLGWNSIYRFLRRVFRIQNFIPTSSSMDWKRLEHLIGKHRFYWRLIFASLDWGASVNWHQLQSDCIYFNHTRWLAFSNEKWDWSGKRLLQISWGECGRTLKPWTSNHECLMQGCQMLLFTRGLCPQDPCSYAKYLSIDLN